MTPPPELIDDAIAEILLRLPPDDPACLVRASLVCKLWHGILSNPTFPDRYREFHPTPPLLGFLSFSNTRGYDDESPGRFVPVTATRIPFRQPAFRCRTLDCRHGRVLLDKMDRTGTITESLAVWDPVTGDHKVLKVLSDPVPGTEPFGDSGVVLCAVAGCSHRRGCCHGAGGPFHVVFVSIVTSYNYNYGGRTNAARAWVYSSETAAWSAATSVQIPYATVRRKRAAIVGDHLYFLLSPGAGILKYDLGKRCLTVVGSPSCTYHQAYNGTLMTMEDGSSLGFAGVDKDDYSTLRLWRATKVNSSGSMMGWVQDRVISLNNPVRITDWPNQVVNIVGFAEGVDILLLGVGEAGRGIMLELKSGQIRKLSKPVYCYYGDYFPYLSVYIIPDFASQKYSTASRDKIMKSELKNLLHLGNLQFIQVVFAVHCLPISWLVVPQNVHYCVGI